MLEETPIRLVRIRPHYISTFAEYLEFGKIYTSEEFRKRAEKLYPHKTPEAQPMQ